jgi:Flp pilus assembly protein protease CpaA
VCAVAVATDLRRRMIYNWLTFPAALAGLVLALAFHGRAGLLSSFAGGFVALLLFGLFAALGWLKMGDVKLMVACGTLLRFPLVLWAITYTALIGGVFGIAYAAYRGRLGNVVGNLGRAAAGTFKRGDQPKLKELSDLAVPYAVAIALGAVWAALTHYVPRALLF